MSLLTLENTAFVLDSTADPPHGYFEQEGVYLVPLTVHFGDETYRDQIDLTHEQFFAKLTGSKVLPTTSQPTVAQFTACYQHATSRYEHVLSLHVSREMSGTCQAAETAAADFPGVHVFDTRTVSTNITLLAERLRARLAQGMTLEAARTYVAYFSANCRCIVHAGTLEYLRRGGRIGRAASVIGGVLDIQPLIQIDGGQMAPFAKVRGARRALATTVGFIEQTTKPDDELFVALIDAFAAERVEELGKIILAVRPKARILMTGQVGAVVGTHIGPGTYAFAMIGE
jgi:DegV family protein with EDD domain